MERRLWLGTLAVAVVGSVATTLALSALYEAKPSPPPEPPRHVKTYRLLDVMHEFQTYSTKLYFAGTAGNQELASWYSWKLESALRDVRQGKIEPYAYNGWDAIELAEMLEEPIADLNVSIKEGDWKAFESKYDRLLQTCNACHAATEHAFVIVSAPKGDQAPRNQKFD